MKIKSKLTFGVGLLFILIVILGLVGAININILKNRTENILTSNYNTLEYSRNMLELLEKIDSKNIETFESYLQKQEHNITEIGEKESTQELRNYFNQYKDDTTLREVLSHMRNELFRLMDMNMWAIKRKSAEAEHTASIATFWIVLTGTLCFLIAFVLLVNLPSTIANPIKELTESITLIASKQYSKRVHFESHSEFGDLAKSFNVMAQKLEEYNNSNLAKLMMEKKRIETLINNMQDPVIGLDEQLKIVFVNEEATKIINLSKQELLGKNTKELAVTNDLIRLFIQDVMMEENNKSNVTGNGKDKSKFVKIYSNGKESYFDKKNLQIFIVPTGEENRVLVGYVVILRNITEYKELDFAKTSFIATVSHEFKTPISSIKMSLELLENEKIGKINTEQKKLIDNIKDSTERLLKITGELLNITQVESGNIQLSIQPTNPSDLLYYALNATKTQAEQKNIIVETTGFENTEYVLADTEKTSWILINFVSNAIRYSHDNSTIFIHLKKENHEMIFSVIDKGQGIAPQYIHRVFERYFKIPGTQKEGTGLGLSISKELVEAQGGSISVESEFGSGSIFSIHLPLATT